MSSPVEQQEERISLGLVEYLSRHTLDEDYERLAHSRPEPGRPDSGRRWSSPIALWLTLALFGLLVYTAASQTTRNAVTEDNDRAELIRQVTDRRATLQTRYDEITRLTEQNKELESDFLNGSRAGASTFAGLRRLSTLTGASAVKGPGVRVVVDNAPHAKDARHLVLDSDLQKLVNGLWEAGAEAISVNGQRVTALSSIREAGEAINLNYRPLRAPYTVLAVGNPKTLPSRFAESTHGATWFDLVRQVGLRFHMQTDESLTLPAAASLSLSYATRPKGGTS